MLEALELQMSRYYSKIALTIPHSREVFLLNHGEKSTSDIDNKIKGLSVEKLKEALKKAHQLKTLNDYRLFVFSVSKTLSDRGIAPRWQGLQKSAESEDQHAALIEDAAIIDLYWLSSTFPKHTTRNQRWQSLFKDGFTLGLALCVSERQMTTAKKIRHELNLSRFQQLGCIHFITKTKYPVYGKPSALSFLKSAKKRSETIYKREMRRAVTMPQINEEVARKRALVYICWMLAEQSPTNAAKLYGWMGDSKTDKATMARTIKRIMEPVSRLHVGISVDR